MQIKWKIKSTLLNGIYVLWCLINIVTVRCDKTNCRSSIETGDGLHFICYCDTDLLDTATERKAHPTIDLKPDSNGKNDFSLAEFAYNLSGAYFRKKVHLTFQYCRHLTIILDQHELGRIGSNCFRPDIQVTSCFIEHVYHLELLHSTSVHKANGKNDGGKVSKYNLVDEYATTFDTKDLDLTVYSVALVKVDAGANFTSLVTSTPESTLYIDLSDGVEVDHAQLDVKGFPTENVYFITRKKQRIPLQEVRLN